MGKLNWHNFLQQAIRQAVEKGVSANTIVLVLLFPLVAGLIAADQAFIGIDRVWNFCAGNAVSGVFSDRDKSRNADVFGDLGAGGGVPQAD